MNADTLALIVRGMEQLRSRETLRDPILTACDCAYGRRSSRPLAPIYPSLAAAAKAAWDDWNSDNAGNID